MLLIKYCLGWAKLAVNLVSFLCNGVEPTRGGNLCCLGLLEQDGRRAAYKTPSCASHLSVSSLLHIGDGLLPLDTHSIPDVYFILDIGVYCAKFGVADFS